MTSYTSANFKTQEICDKAVGKDPWSLAEVPDNFKTKAVETDPRMLKYVADQLKTQEMYNPVVDHFIW